MNCNETKTYFKEKSRMLDCRSENCHKCPLSFTNNGKNLTCAGLELSYPEEVIAIVQKWSDENPIETWESKIKKLLPNIVLFNGDCPSRYFGAIATNEHCDSKCSKCWQRPYIEIEVKK